VAVLYHGDTPHKINDSGQIRPGRLNAKLTPRVTAGHASCMPLDPLKYKGGSQWWYPWVPVAAPIAGALVGVGIFSWLLG